MFLKLTENTTGADVYLNPEHIVRFLPNPAGTGTLIFMTQDACVNEMGSPQLIDVHECAEEVFRIISRSEKPGKNSQSRGLI